MSSHPVEHLEKWGSRLLKAGKKSVFFLALLNILRFSIRHFVWGWIAVLGISFLDTVWLANNAWLAVPAPWMACSSLFLLINIKLLCCALEAAEIPGLRPVLSFFRKISLGPRFFLGAEYIALSASATLALCILSYLTCTLPYPLIDRQLSYVDHVIGFDWLVWYRRSQHFAVYAMLWLAYISIIPQFIFFTIWFAFLSRKDRLYEMFWVLFAALLLTIFISGFLPALGPAFLLNWTPSEAGLIKLKFGQPMLDMMLVRSGITPDFASHRPTGIITFPSFHTVCAIVYCYGFRRTGFVGYVVFLLNVLMLTAIPVLGNHYLVDMIAGAIIALISIIAVGILRRKKEAPFSI